MELIVVLIAGKQLMFFDISHADHKGRRRRIKTKNTTNKFWYEENETFMSNFMHHFINLIGINLRIEMVWFLIHSKDTMTLNIILDRNYNNKINDLI